MLQRTSGFDTHLAAAAEQQMRKWAIGLEVQDRLCEHGKLGGQLLRPIQPYVAISREARAGGGAIAQRLHDMLGWGVTVMNRLFQCKGLVGLGLAVLAGWVIGSVWPSVPLHAVATDRYDTCVIATGPIDSEVEGVYVLDGLTGNLKAAVLSRHTGKFNAYFERNVMNDFGIAPPSGVKFLLVTGAVDLLQGPRITQPSQAVIYVAEVTSGRIAAYAVPWLRQRYAANQPIVGHLVPLDMWQFRVTLVRDRATTEVAPK